MDAGSFSAKHFPWRAPRAADWVAQWRAADAAVRAFGPQTDAAALCAKLRSLAGQQLDAGEQLKLEGTARRLLPHADKLPLRRFRLGLIGNRTLTYLINPLRAAGLARGLLLDAVEAPFDSASSFAFGNAEIFDGAPDAVLAVLDDAAFPRAVPLSDEAAEDKALAEARDFLDRMADTARDKVGVPFILANVPPAGAQIASADLAIAGTTPRFVARLNDAIAAGAAARDWILWDLAGLAARLGADDWFDPVRFYEAKTPFRIELCPLVADRLSALVAAMTGKSCRALVLDLDNTLWGGVIGDDGMAGIRLGQNSPEGEAYIAFQKFILELRQRGVVLAVSSKNNDEVAREPFRAHPEMLLKEDHFAVFQANWDDKASNLQAVAETLSLGLESLCFVDDNPAERARVRQELPLVTVPEIGADPALYADRIARSGAFEHLVLNADDIGRATSYAGLAARAELKSKVGNYDDYLKSLAMTLTVSRFDAVGRARIAQLINKSNQFNLTTRRYSEEDVRRFEEDPSVLCWQARLSDTFGDHGMIGVVIVRTAESVWTIDTWLMSCRVLMRGVEETLMNLLVARARAAGVKRIEGEYIPTPRNAMVADFYPRLGFAPAGEHGGAARFACVPERWDLRASHIAVDDTRAA